MYLVVQSNAAGARTITDVHFLPQTGMRDGEWAIDVSSDIVWVWTGADRSWHVESMTDTERQEAYRELALQE